MTDSPSKTNPKVITLTKPDLTWQTVLFNCNCHTFETVIDQLMKAIKCSFATASQYAFVADQLGSITVYRGSNTRCEAVADILGSVGLDVKVSQ